MENNKPCRACIVRNDYVSLGGLIVVGESLGWISYNMDLDSFLFIIFLIYIVSYQDKNHKNKINNKKIHTVESQNVKN